MITKELTPRSHRAMMQSLDDSGCVTRMEPIWDTMAALEMDLACTHEEAASLEIRLKERIDNLDEQLVRAIKTNEQMQASLETSEKLANEYRLAALSLLQENREPSRPELG